MKELRLLKIRKACLAQIPKVPKGFLWKMASPVAKAQNILKMKLMHLCVFA